MKGFMTESAPLSNEGDKMDDEEALLPRVLTVLIYLHCRIASLPCYPHRHMICKCLLVSAGGVVPLDLRFGELDAKVRRRSPTWRIASLLGVKARTRPGYFCPFFLFLCLPGARLLAPVDFLAISQIARFLLDPKSISISLRKALMLAYPTVFAHTPQKMKF